MHFIQNLAAIAAVVAVVGAVPAVTPNEATPENTFEKRTQYNECGPSSFVGNTSGASPKVADCKTIVKNISGGGRWTTTQGESRKLVSFGTCAFSVHNLHTDPSLVAYVGNRDIIDLINDSIAKFASDGKVGAHGKMKCNGTPGYKDGMYWQIYHN
jgi:hypothetical protein